MDESGKNGDQLIVGSVWFLEFGKPIYDIYRRIKAFKEEVGFTKEFHFANMNRSDLGTYQKMLQIFLREAPSYSFKIISVPIRGIQNRQEAFKHLFYHLMIKGYRKRE